MLGTRIIETGGLVVYGVADAERKRVLGTSGGTFAGTTVRLVTEGPVAALTGGCLPRLFKDLHLPGWLPRRKPAFPVRLLSALSSVFPFAPVRPLARFENEESLRSMLAARSDELTQIVALHADCVQCDVMAFFDRKAAEDQLMSAGPLGNIQAVTPAEAALLARTLNQTVSGREAEFIARLNRCLAEHAADTRVPESATGGADFARCVLIKRGSRNALVHALGRLSDEFGSTARIVAGAFGPPSAFASVEIGVPSLEAVSAAQLALGLEERVERTTIRVAYRRSLERVQPTSGIGADASEALARQFALLESVAQGQACQGRQFVALDAASLQHTWLLKLHASRQAA